MYFWSTNVPDYRWQLDALFSKPVVSVLEADGILLGGLALRFSVASFSAIAPLVKRFFGLVDGLNLDQVTDRAQWTKLNLVWVLFFIVVSEL